MQQQKRKSSKSAKKVSGEIIRDFLYPPPTDFVTVLGEPIEQGHEAFAQRLLKITEQTGGPLALARKVGVANSSIHSWLRNAEPARKHLVAIADKTGTSVEWLATGRGPMRADRVPEGYAVIEPTTNIGEPGKPRGTLKGADQLAFKLDWLRSLPGAPTPATLFLTHANGDAMAPTLQDSDLVLVNFADERRHLRDGIYAIILLGDPPTFLIRRIQRRGSDFRVLCDNPAYPPEPVGSEYDGAVFARVIWFARVL
jgi:phage repressor protein C with HTH and peptisase S24 domain